MTGPSNEKPEVEWASAPTGRIPQLTEYIDKNVDRFTPDALRASAIEAGYTTDEIDAAFRLARDRDHPADP